MNGARHDRLALAARPREGRPHHDPQRRLALAAGAGEQHDGSLGEPRLIEMVEQRGRRFLLASALGGIERPEMTKIDEQEEGARGRPPSQQPSPRIVGELRGRADIAIQPEPIERGSARAREPRRRREPTQLALEPRPPARPRIDVARADGLRQPGIGEDRRRHVAIGSERRNQRGAVGKREQGLERAGRLRHARLVADAAPARERAHALRDGHAAGDDGGADSDDQNVRRRSTRRR